MKKLRIIWQLLTRKWYVVYTADKKGNKNYDHHADSDDMFSMWKMQDECLNLDEAVEAAKNIIAGTV